MSRIVVTGSTGHIGGGVARRLADAGASQLLLVRDPTRASALPLADVTRAGFTGAAAVMDAIEPGDTILMVSASETLDRFAQHTAFVDAAVAGGTGHLVYISFYGAAPEATFTFARRPTPPSRTANSTG